MALITPAALSVQSHNPSMAIYPIQDTVLAMYTMTCTVPPERPFSVPLVDLYNAIITVADTPFDEDTSEMHSVSKHVETLQRIRRTWSWFAKRNPTHPTVKTLARFQIPFECSGWGIISLMLPETMEFHSTDHGSDSFQNTIRPGREFPVRVTRGLLVQGIVTNRMVGSSAAGMLAHVAHYHGKQAAIRFTNNMQVLASHITCKSTATYSLYDCMLPSTLARAVREDINDHLEQAAITRCSGSNMQTAGASRKQALGQLMRAKERSEWIVSRYIRTPFHYVSYLEATVAAEVAGREQETASDREELLNHLMASAERRREADPLFDNFDARCQPGLMLDSQCKGTVSGISQVYQALGQQALGTERCIVEGMFGRTQALYRGPHMVACMTPQTWNAIANTYYRHHLLDEEGGDKCAEVATVQTAVQPKYDSFNRHAPPLPPGSPSPTVNADAASTSDVAHYHAARLLGHSHVPSKMRRTVLGKAYQQSVFETTGPSVRLCEMKTHLRHQGFNNESGLGLGLRPTNNAIYAMCARSSLVGVTSNTSANGYMLRSAVQAMQDVKSHHDGTLRSPFGLVAPSLTQTGVHPQKMYRVAGEKYPQFVDVQKLAMTVNNMVPIASY